MAELIYSKYSNERSRKFAIRTDILEGENGRTVEKRALYPEGKSHVERIAYWYGRLKEVYSAVPFACNRCELTKDGVRLEYLTEGTFEELLDALVGDGRGEEAEQLLEDYLKKIKNICSEIPFVMTEGFREVFGEAELPDGLMSGEVTNIDMVCQNLVMTEIPTVLDYEWTFDFPVPGEFVLYRVIHYYTATSPERACVDGEGLCRKFGITKELTEIFTEMEAAFQQYLTQEHTPMREMFRDITPGIVRIHAETPDTLQVFFAGEEGYREEDSVCVRMDQGSIKKSFTVPDGCRKVRIDPGDEPCSVYLEEISFDGNPADLVKAAVPEGEIMGKSVYIAKNDPGIWDIPVPAGAETLRISLRIIKNDKETIKKLLEKEAENRRLKAKVQAQARLITDMKNTKVWKMYEAYRKKVERKK